MVRQEEVSKVGIFAYTSIHDATLVKSYLSRRDWIKLTNSHCGTRPDLLTGCENSTEIVFIRCSELPYLCLSINLNLRAERIR